jgi:hypothetical protein
VRLRGEAEKNHMEQKKEFVGKGQQNVEIN